MAYQPVSPKSSGGMNLKRGQAGADRASPMDGSPNDSGKQRNEEKALLLLRGDGSW